MKIAAASAAGWFQVLQIYSREEWEGERGRKTSLFPNGPRNPGAFGPSPGPAYSTGPTRETHTIYGR